MNCIVPSEDWLQHNGLPDVPVIPALNIDIYTIIVFLLVLAFCTWIYRI